MAMAIPPFFKCPISMDLFTDPVTLSTGQTYDRPSIERWLAAGNPTCPVTMQLLRDKSLVPNHTLRHLINQCFVSGGGAPGVGEAAGIGTALTVIKLKLVSPETTTKTKLDILEKVRVLSMESETGQLCLIQHGFFPFLFRRLFGEPVVLTEVAMECLVSLSPETHSDSMIGILRENQNLDHLVSWFKHGTLRMKICLCYLMEVLSSFPGSEELCIKMGQSRKIVDSVVTLLDNQEAETSDAAAGALFKICSGDAGRRNAIKGGALDGLVTYLLPCSSRQNAAAKALAAVELLVVMESGRRALMKNPKAVPALVRMVFRVSSGIEGSEHAAGALLLVCRSSTKAVAQAVKAGVLKQLLLMQSQYGRSRETTKAVALLKLLRCMWVDTGGMCDFHGAM